MSIVPPNSNFMPLYPTPSGAGVSQVGVLATSNATLAGNVSQGSPNLSFTICDQVDAGTYCVNISYRINCLSDGSDPTFDTIVVTSPGLGVQTTQTGLLKTGVSGVSYIQSTLSGLLLKNTSSVWSLSAQLSNAKAGSSAYTVTIIQAFIVKVSSGAISYYDSFPIPNPPQ